MTSIGEYLDSMVVTATSPDGNIDARVSNYTQVRVSFRPGAFERYDEDRLGHQLARLGIVTWVTYHRARSEAYRRSQGLSTGELADAERPAADPHLQRYAAELDTIGGEGVSSRGAVRIRTVGMMQWNVHIEPGSLSRLGERLLLEEIQSAMAALLRDRQTQIIGLKSEYFDLGIPRRWRDLMTELRSLNRRRE